MDPLSCQSGAYRRECFSELHGTKTHRCPESVVRIDSEAFRGCSCLEEVRIQSAATQLSPDAFHDCPNLRILRTADKIFGGKLDNGSAESDFVILAEQLLTYTGYSDYIHVPEGVTRIARTAFDRYFASFDRLHDTVHIELPQSLQYLPGMEVLWGSQISISLPHGFLKQRRALDPRLSELIETKWAAQVTLMDLAALYLFQPRFSEWSVQIQKVLESQAQEALACMLNLVHGSEDAGLRRRILTFFDENADKLPEKTAQELREQFQLSAELTTEEAARSELESFDMDRKDLENLDKPGFLTDALQYCVPEDAYTYVEFLPLCETVLELRKFSNLGRTVKFAALESWRASDQYVAGALARCLWKTVRQYFCISEKGECKGVLEASCSIAGDADVALAHPMELTAPVLDIWRMLLEAREEPSMDAQIEEPRYRIEDVLISRYSGCTVPTARLQMWFGNDHVLRLRQHSKRSLTLAPDAGAGIYLGVQFENVRYSNGELAGFVELGDIHIKEINRRSNRILYELDRLTFPERFARDDLSLKPFVVMLPTARLEELVREAAGNGAGSLGAVMLSELDRRRQLGMGSDTLNL